MPELLTAPESSPSRQSACQDKNPGVEFEVYGFRLGFNIFWSRFQVPGEGCTSHFWLYWGYIGVI